MSEVAQEGQAYIMERVKPQVFFHRLDSHQRTAKGWLRMCGRYILRSRGSAKFYGVPASQLPFQESFTLSNCVQVDHLARRRLAILMRRGGHDQRQVAWRVSVRARSASVRSARPSKLLQVSNRFMAGLVHCVLLHLFNQIALMFDVSSIFRPADVT